MEKNAFFVNSAVWKKMKHALEGNNVGKPVISFVYYLCRGVYEFYDFPL